MNDNLFKAELHYKLFNNKDTIKEMVSNNKISFSDYVTITGDNWEDIDINLLKQFKIQELYYALSKVINTSFKSSATGVEHVYGYDSNDQNNINKQSNSFNMEKELYGTIQTVTIPWFTLDAGWIEHTPQEFYSVLKDASLHENVQWNIFKQKSIDVQNAITIEDIKNITLEGDNIETSTV